MNTARRNRSSLLRSAVVAAPIALLALAPMSALAESRPTPVPHDGSLVGYVTQHKATDPAPAASTKNTDPAGQGADARDPLPGAYRGAHAEKVRTADGAASSAPWHSWEWRIDGGPGE